MAPEAGSIGWTRSTGTEARGRRVALAICCALGGAGTFGSQAAASTPHVVVAGETLSGIAAANGLGTESLAAWNGLPADHPVIEGTTISVPSTEEAGVGSTASAESGSTGSHVVAWGESLSSIAAANGLGVTDLAAANGLSSDAMLLEGTSLTIPAATSVSTAPALGTIWSPSGTLYLDPAAAESWNAMRDASLGTYGIDLYPAGPLSAYRTYEQQAELYDLFLGGTGAPANPPGESSHELGLSVDLADEQMLAIVDEIGWQYGWGRFEAPDEWWHVTYGG